MSSLFFNLITNTLLFKPNKSLPSHSDTKKWGARPFGVRLGVISIMTYLTFLATTTVPAIATSAMSAKIIAMSPVSGVETVSVYTV